MSPGQGSENPTQVQRLGYPRKAAEVLYVFERRHRAFSRAQSPERVELGPSGVQKKSWGPQGSSESMGRTPPGSQRGSRSPKFTEAAAERPTPRGLGPAGIMEKGMGVSLATQRLQRSALGQ